MHFACCRFIRPRIRQPKSKLARSYELAGNHAFRLLQIYPSSDPTAQVETRLFSASLDDPPLYDALSYRWEGSGNNRFIIVNGVKVPVLENLYSALVQLRQQTLPATGTFWIDSICINQASIQDRNEQVQLMGLIYSKAQVVRIWAGTESGEAEKAFKLVEDCGTFSPQNEQAVIQRVTGDEAGTKALTNLLQRSYWNRMWVFQEIVLARRATVHCGQQQAPWWQFIWHDKISARHQLWMTAQIRHSWILDLRKALFRIAHFCIRQNQIWYVNNVLHPTRHLQCQDHRDKMYALRGVCLPLAKNLEPDYSVPVRDVYTAFAKSQIKEYGNLSALLTAGLWNPSNGEDIRLPSWVPDLRGMGGVDIRYLAGSYMKCFEADDTVENSSHFDEEDGHSILNVQSLLVDSVHIHRQLDANARYEKKRRELVMDFCQTANGKELSMVQLRRYFQVTIFADSTFFSQGSKSGSNSKERMEKLILGFYEELHQLFGWRPVFTRFVRSFEDVGINCMGDRGMGAFDSDEMHLNRMEYLFRMRETIDNEVSSIFMTRHGRIGIGPRTVEQGDHVAVIRCCRVPMLLRRCGTYLRLVGPSYVSGLMQKEAVLAAKDSNFELEFQWVKLA